MLPKSYMLWIDSMGHEMNDFYLLDRVIYVGPSSAMFALPGVIIGVYPVFGKYGRFFLATVIAFLHTFSVVIFCVL